MNINNEEIFDPDNKKIILGEEMVLWVQITL